MSTFPFHVIGVQLPLSMVTELKHGLRVVCNRKGGYIFIPCQISLCEDLPFIIMLCSLKFLKPAT